MKIHLPMNFKMVKSMKDDDFSSAGEVLNTLFKRLIPEDKTEYAHFFSGWEDISGKETAMHVRPRDIVNNVLILETDHPIWSQQIRMKEGGLLKKISGKYPSLEIKKIKVVIGHKEQKEKIESKSIVQKELTEKENKKNDAASESFFALLETMRKRGDS